jgi:hypothetical protein
MIEIKIKTIEDMLEFFQEYCLRDNSEKNINIIIDYALDIESTPEQVRDLYQLLKSKEIQPF